MRVRWCWSMVIISLGGVTRRRDDVCCHLSKHVALTVIEKGSPVIDRYTTPFEADHC